MRLSDLAICAKYELRFRAGRTFRRLTGRRTISPIPCRVPTTKQKLLILRQGFAVADGKPSWFYSALDRGDADPLTNFSLRYIVANAPKSSEILVTGCGTGITAFYLADAGFEHVTGLDLLPACISVANEVKRVGNYTGTEFVVGDGLRPTLTRSYDLITALHWVFSAWMGNYGNDPVESERARDPHVRERLLSDLLAQYVPHLRPEGTLMIELTDAVTDYRLSEDHPLGEASSAIYPVRHTPDQVEKCAREQGLAVIEKQLCVSYGHHPRTLYVLKNAEAGP
jgi:SAM-dependent methyltransferase